MQTSGLFTKSAVWLWLAICLSISQLSAQTTFVGPAGGDWFDPGNWSNGLPAAGNNATIPGPASATIGAPLTVNFQIDNFGGLQLNAALANNAGGTINNAGTLTVGATGSITNKATFNNFGSASFAGPANFVNDPGASFGNSGTFTLQTTLQNNGDVINNGTLDALGGAVLTSGTFDNRQTFNVLSLTVQAAGNFTNNFGANLNVQGTGANLLVDGLFANNGFLNIRPGATASLRNVFTNNGALTNEGNLTLTSTGRLDNQGTVLNKNLFTANAQVTNNNSFFNEATADIFAVFGNNNTIENRAGGNLTLRPGASLTMNFGSQLLNLGTVTNEVNIVSVGTINNNGAFNNNGTIDNNSGGTVRNTLTFNNNGILNSQNQLFDDGGTWTNTGTMNVNSGSVFQVSAAFVNAPTGKVNNLFEILVKPGGTFTNNGVLPNNIRIFIEGSLTNNAYVLNTGDVFVRTGGTLTNKEVFENVGGNVDNAGTLVNQDQFLLDECSSLKNTGAINNTGGVLQNKAIVIQRGTLTGNAIQNVGGYIHTAATSAAPAICQNATITADDQGVVKAYATFLIAFENFDSCQNILYTANGIPRPTFACSDIGTVKNLNIKLLTRLGDSLTCVSQVTPVDQLAPRFNNCPADQTIFTVGTSAAATWTAPTAIDNCTATPTITTTHAPGASFPVGITGVTYTARDAALNAQVCQFRISVVQTPGTSNCTGDATPPAFVNCPSNINLSSDFPTVKVTWNSPSLTDNCYPLSLSSTHLPGSDFAVGTTTVRYTAKDGNNNTSTCQFAVTVVQNNLCITDTQKPSFFNCPANQFAPTNPDINGAVVRWTAPGVFDNCAITNLTQTAQSGNIFPVGTTAVVYTATDGSGNTATCAFTVLVGNDPCPGDATGPTITGCPANQSISTSGASATATWSNPSASDPCGGVTLTSNFQPGASFPVGITQVVYQASDRKGNRSTCAFNVTVVNVCQSDATPPTIANCPANQTVASTNGSSATANWAAPTATDACGLISFTSSYLPGATFPIGTTSVVYTATDIKGNTSSCAFNIVVVTIPTCTQNASPINNATNQPTASVTLSWNSAANAASYDVFFGTANPPTTRVGTSITGTSFAVTNLAQGTTYFWYVVPKNGSGSASGCASSVTRFTTTAPPPVPTCTQNASPINNATNVAPASVALSWNSVANATSYDVFFGTANPPTATVATNVTTNSFTVSNLAQGATYFWYVVPKGASGAATGCSSSVTRFTTTAPVVGGCTGRTALFVVGNTTLGAGDAWVKARLESLGFAVTVKTGIASVSADATGKSLVVVSTTISSGDVTSKFTNVAVPVVTWESYIFDDMKMTGSGTEVDYGSGGTTTALDITNTAHPLAGGLSGSPAVYTSAQLVRWGIPSAAAIKVGRLPGSTTRFGVFGYETGSAMVGLNAPARRVGLFFDDLSPSAATAQGAILFDAAVNWATNCANPSFDPNKCYKITNKATGKVLDVFGSQLQNGADLIQWPLHSGTNQQFQISDVGSGFVKIAARHSSKVVDIEGVSTLDGAYAHQWEYVGQQNQQFKIEDAGDGYVKITARHSGKALGLETSPGVDGTRIVQRTYNSATDAQKWLIQELPCGSAACNPTALLVVGNTTLSSGDAAIKSRLEGYGLAVTVVSDAALTSANAAGKGVAIVSSTILSGNVNTKLTNASVPVVCYEPYLFDELKMVSSIAESDYGTWTENRLNVLAPQHPIAAGMSGFRTVMTAANTMTWGKPGAGATLIAQIPNQPGKNGIFCYESGAAMVGQNAPARRVGLFLHDFTSTNLTADGWRFFDASLEWAMNCPFLTNQVLAAPTPTLAFSAARKNFDVQLKWTSTTGPENDYFVVERRASEVDTWHPILKTAGYGPADEILYFNELDKNPLPGDNIYRLRSVRRDGSERTTEEQRVFVPFAADFGIFPNPAHEQAFIELRQFAGKNVSVTVLDALGTTVQYFEIVASEEPQALDLRALQNGHYAVLLRCEGLQRTGRLVVNKN